MEENQQ